MYIAIRKKKIFQAADLFGTDQDGITLQLATNLWQQTHVHVT